MRSKPQSGIKLLVVGGVLAITGLAGCASFSFSPPSIPSLPIPNASIPSPDLLDGNNARLPADWPADVPQPAGIPLKNAVQIGSTDRGPSASAVYTGPGDTKAVYADLVNKFKANGFTSKADYSDSSGGGSGVSVWEKGNIRVQLLVMSQNGNVVVNETVMTKTTQN